MKSNRKYKRRGRGKGNKLLLVTVIALAVAVIATGAYVFLHWEKKYTITDVEGVKSEVTLEEMRSALSGDKIYPGIFVNGVDVSNKSIDEALALFQEDKKLDSPEIEITLEVNPEKFTLNEEQLSFTSNLDEKVKEAYETARSSAEQTEEKALVDRYTKLINLQKSPLKLETQYQVDGQRAETFIKENLEPLEVAAVNAKATDFDVNSLQFVIEEGTTGRDLDVESAITEVKAALAAGEYKKTITVKSNVVEPELSKDELASKLGKVSSTTTKTTDNANRNVNVDLIAKAINGLVLQPGESFDFNSFIGERTAEKGYKEAGGIYDGQLRQELGGGICQTNSTLFHSVVKADLKVDSRTAHSWPMEYVDVGTDATVSWGWPEFKFTNSTEYPLAIVSYYSQRQVTVEIYGRAIEDNMTIKFVGQKTEEHPPKEGPEYVAAPDLPVGKTEVDRKPRNYIAAESYKIYYKDGVEIKRELAFKTVYAAIRERIKVGVKAPDGSIYSMDPATGVVQVPTPPPPTEPAPTETAPPETQAPPAPEAPAA